METGPVYENTLLIVESPTIARIIDQFKLPGLQVWSSAGYCWKPIYNHHKKRLQIRVNPTQTSDRNHLKSLARWATQIIVATDNDPSGIFLAEAIRKFLKGHRVHRGFLSTLSSDSILKTIRDAKPLNQQDFFQLERRWIARNKLCNSGNNDEYLWIKAALISLFSDPPYKLRYLDQHGHPWRPAAQPEKPGETQQVRKPEAWFPEPFQPPTTLCLLAFLKKSDDNFQQLQYQLEQLFTQSAQQGFGISYPRTASPFWYDSTWEQLTQKFQTKYGIESVLQHSLRSQCRSAAHEALHVIDPVDNHPDHVRPELRRAQFLAYQKLHQLTCRAIQAVPHISPPEGARLTPIITTQDLCRFLAEFHACSPSSIGSITDWLIRNQYIILREGSDEVKPGTQLKKLIQQLETKEVTELIYLLQTLIDDRTRHRQNIIKSANELRTLFGNDIP